MTSTDTSLRTHLRANMFDGDEGGNVTMPCKSLLDEVCENVVLWLIEQSGVQDLIDDYYKVPEAGGTGGTSNDT